MLRRTTTVLIPIGVAALLSSIPACEDPSWNYVDDDLVTGDAVSIAGKVYVISPYGNRVIQIDEETLEIQSVEVGKSPQVLTTDLATHEATGEPVHIYTINRDDSTLSIIDVEEFDADPETYVPGELQLKPFFDQLVFSPSGDTIISYIGQNVSDADLTGHGSVNPNEIAVIDLSVDPPSVDFMTLESRPTSVVFTDDGDNAVIPMTTDLVVLRLDDMHATHYPLSLETDDPARPSLIKTSPDGSRVYVAVANENDVYVIDLDNVIFETLIPAGFTPTDIQVTPDGAWTVVAGGSSQVTYFDNEVFEPEQINVGTAVDTIVMNDDESNPYCFLYGTNPVHNDFAMVTFGVDGVDEETFVTEDSVVRIDLDPSGQTAVIFHGDSGYGNGRLSMFNIEQRLPSMILLESPPYDMTFLPASSTFDDETIGYVMVVLKDSNTLVRYSLDTYEAVVIGVASAPESVGALHQSDLGTIYVVHDEPLGLMTFLNPYQPLALPGGFRTVYGYGLAGVMD